MQFLQKRGGAALFDFYQNLMFNVAFPHFVKVQGSMFISIVLRLPRIGLDLGIRNLRCSF